MSQVFVLDKKKKPLMPCSSMRARELLDTKKAVVHKIYPFTIRLKNRTGGEIQPVSIKFDPGSKYTGVAITREASEGTYALFGAEIHHRGSLIKKNLESRANYRRRRRGNLRYRAPRFLNRKRREGWLAPSVQHRVDNVINWTTKLQRLCPISLIAVEQVKFDMQKMMNPEISGKEYQQGTLFEYEVREYLLEKWGRKCCYCDKENVPLNIEHILAKSNGGSNRISNLAIACVSCNQKKGSRYIEEFLKNDLKRLAKILAQLKRPLHDAAAVNSSRNAIVRDLNKFGLPLKIGTGSETKWNRKQFNIPKSHVNDALCIGNDLVAVIDCDKINTLIIEAKGRGRYRRTNVTLQGFPTSFCTRIKQVKGFQTGCIVSGKSKSKKNTGKYIGYLYVKGNGSAYMKKMP